MREVCKVPGDGWFLSFTKLSRWQLVHVWNYWCVNVTLLTGPASNCVFSLLGSPKHMWKAKWEELYVKYLDLRFPSYIAICVCVPTRVWETQCDLQYGCCWDSVDGSACARLCVYPMRSLCPVAVFELEWFLMKTSRSVCEISSPTSSKLYCYLCMCTYTGVGDPVWPKVCLSTSFSPLRLGLLRGFGSWT